MKNRSSIEGRQVYPVGQKVERVRVLGQYFVARRVKVMSRVFGVSVGARRETPSCQPELVRIHECLPLLCPTCFAPMQIVAFIEEPRGVESILRHIGEPTQAPAILPARAPPRREM